MRPLRPEGEKERMMLKKFILVHSSEKRRLCLKKLSSKTVQNLLYFWNKKTQIVFIVFHFEQL